MKGRIPIKNAGDAILAKDYLVRKCSSSGEQFLTRGRLTQQAFIRALEKMDFSDQDSMEVDLLFFNKLCIENLNDVQWSALKNALRVKRAKAKNGLVRADLTPEAHARLQDYIERKARENGNRLTLSEAILTGITPDTQ